MQTFTRKWNAKRHCNTHHEGIFDSIIFFNEYMTVTKTMNKTYPALPNQDVYSYNKNHLPHQENLFVQDNSTLIPNIDKNCYQHKLRKIILQSWKCCYQIY